MNITADELLTKASTGEILPDQTPDFTWNCTTEYTYDSDRDECTTTLTLTVGDDETTGAWERSDRLRGWDRLTTIAALRELDAYGEVTIVFKGWIAIVTRHEDGAQIWVDIDVLAHKVTHQISSNDPSEWTKAVNRQLDHLLNDATTD